jgi:1,4-dihydroxy-2-naphthoate octaprenyltransferase
MGLLIVAILVVNNLRDIESDQATGKRTLAVRLGVSGTRIEYLACLVGAYLIPLGLWLGRLATPWILLSWLSIPMAAKLVGAIWRDQGGALNNTLAGTGRLTLIYALLFSLGILVG